MFRSIRNGENFLKDSLKMRLVTWFRESIVLIWLILWYIKDINEHKEQHDYEESLQKGEIG